MRQSPCTAAGQCGGSPHADFRGHFHQLCSREPSLVTTPSHGRTALPPSLRRLLSAALQNTGFSLFTVSIKPNFHYSRRSRREEPPPVQQRGRVSAARGPARRGRAARVRRDHRGVFLTRQAGRSTAPRRVPSAASAELRGCGAAVPRPLPPAAPRGAGGKGPTAAAGDGAGAPRRAAAPAEEAARMAGVFWLCSPSGTSAGAAQS